MVQNTMERAMQISVETSRRKGRSTVNSLQAMLFKTVPMSSPRFPPTPGFRYIEWRYVHDPVWKNRMDTRGHDLTWPEVNLDSINYFYENNMRCSFPNDPRWWGKPLCQPHSGVPVPKRILQEQRRAVRVTGGDFQTEIYPAAVRRDWKQVLERHNLVLGGKQGGKRSYVDSRPLAPSPAAQTGWNDPRGSWSNPQAEHAADSSSSWAGWEQPHGHSQGASSSAHPRADGHEAAQSQSRWERENRPTYKCPICGAFTPLGDRGHGWCQKCNGFPWMCDRWVERRGLRCNTWNPPWLRDCAICFPNRQGDYDNRLAKRRR